MKFLQPRICASLKGKCLDVVVDLYLDHHCVIFSVLWGTNHSDGRKLFVAIQGGIFFLAQGPALKEGFVSEPFENVNVYSLMCHLLGIKPAPNNGSLQAVQHLLKEHKHDYTVLIVVSVISVLVLLLMSYGIVSFCVKNHCRIRQYGHIYDLGTSELFDL